MIFLHRNPSSKTLATLPARNGSANDGCLVLFGERPLEWGRKSGANTRQMLQKTTRFFICRLKFWIDVLILHGRHSQTLLVNHFHQTNEFGIVNFELALGTKVFRDFDQSYQWSLGNEIQAVHASQACHWNDWDDVLRCAKKVFTVRSLHDSSGERLELKFSRFPPHPRRFRVLHLSTYALPRVRGFPSPLLCRQLDEHLDSRRKHQKIKLNELQVQCRLWNCVKKEGFCKVNTDQRISKNHILSSFGFVVMSRTSNFSMFLWGTQLVHFAEQGAVQAVFGPPGLLLFGLTKAVPWQPKVPGLLKFDGFLLMWKYVKKIISGFY